MGVQRGAERAGERNPVGEGRALGAKPGTGRSDDDVAGPSKSGRPDPLPATVFGPDDTGVVDKAGNIRLDTLNSRKIGQAFNAEQIQAARRLLLQSAIDVHERMQDAWPPGRGSTSVTTSQARCSAAPARRGTCRLPGSLLLEARHDQGLEGDRAAVGAAVFELLLVAIFLRSHLADQPFARIDLQPTMFDHIGFGRFDSRIIPFTSAYGLSALLRSIGDLMDFVE